MKAMKLKSYKCHKIVQAAAILYITSDEHNVFVTLESEPEVPHPLDPSITNRYLPVKGDYLVQYEDGYLSFSPKDVFEAGYSLLGNEQELIGLAPLGSFSWALMRLKEGAKVARSGWNGKGMFAYLVGGSEFKVNRAPLLGIYPEGTDIKYRPHIDLRTADGTIATWAPSGSDTLAEDWEDVG